MASDSMDKSPSWGTNIKLIVGLTLVALAAGFLILFRAFIPPLLLTIILIYLLHPLISRLSKIKGLNWRWAVNIVFIVLVLFSLSAIALMGVAVVQQFQSLINVIDRFINDLPQMVADFSIRVFMLGPFRIDMSRYLDVSNIESSLQRLLELVQPVIGRAGSLLGTIASGAATTIGWGFLILILAYFILSDMVKVQDHIKQIELPGYGPDIQRILGELSRIWNAFLRGQMIMFTLSVIIYAVLLPILGVRYALALALVSGLARFVPYVGQWVNWAVLLLVLVFQKSNYFGLSSLNYVILVVVIVFVVDQIMDNFVSPRIMGRSVGVHPAAVLMAALLGYSILGIVGVIVAAPGLASIILMGRYISRKMLDLDPWPENTDKVKEPEYPWTRMIRLARLGYRYLRKWLKRNK